MIEVDLEESSDLWWFCCFKSVATSWEIYGESIGNGF